MSKYYTLEELIYKANSGVTDASKKRVSVPLQLRADSTDGSGSGLPVDGPGLIAQAPSIVSIPTPQEFTNGTGGTYDFSQHVTEDESSPIVYSISPSLASGLSINSSTGLLTYDGEGAEDTTEYTLTVSNNTGNSVSPAFNIVINAAPAQPGTYTPTHFVAPYASVSGATSDSDTVNGTAYSSATSSSTPCTLGEALANATAGDVVQVGAGVYTGTNTSSNSEPAWNPSNSGTSGSPIVFVAENLASGLDQSTIGSNANRTELRSGSTTDGAGCPAFGALNVDYIRWVGMYVDENNSATSSDTGPVVIEDCDGCRIESCVIQGNDYDWSDNHCGVRIERATDVHVFDCYIRDFGASSHFAGILLYDCNTLYLHHNTFTNVDVAISIKGEQQAGEPILKPPMEIHHNYIDHGTVTGGRAFNIQTPQDNAGYYIDIYQNVVIGSRILIRMGPVGSNQINDVRFVNNTFNTDASLVGDAILFGTGVDSGCYDSMVFANNIFYDGTAAYAVTNALNFFSTGTFQNNYYYSVPTTSGFVYDGTAYRDYSWWTTNHESTASTSDPLLANFAGDDYRISDSSQSIGSGDSPCLDDGVDILNLLGNGTSGAINCGAYILADQSDEIGVR